MPTKVMIMTSGVTRGSVPAINPPWPTQASGTWKKAFRFFSTAVVVSRERRELAALDDRMLKDIGLSRSVAEREISREFFDVPEHRMAHF
ncbi:MAG: DUF1127 domain-containing protein [Hyphomicrobiaceae bacterium]